MAPVSHIQLAGSLLPHSLYASNSAGAYAYNKKKKKKNLAGVTHACHCCRGGKGQGKSFQTELAMKKLGIEPVIMSAGARPSMPGLSLCADSVVGINITQCLAALLNFYMGMNVPAGEIRCGC